jgi:putative multiple sugar transport system substrate-binding protein
VDDAGSTLEGDLVRRTILSLATAGLLLALAACGAPAKTASVYANQGAHIGISLPTTTSTRWIADAKAMIGQFNQMGYQANVVYAQNNVASQVKQVQQMIDAGDKLLVISAVDGGSLTDVLAKAAAKKIPVIAYDRLLTNTKNVSCQATFDNTQVGVMQAKLLVTRLGLTSGKSGPFSLEMFAGSSTDANALAFYKGSMSVLQPYFDSGKLAVRSAETTFAQTVTADYNPDLAQKRMSRLLVGNYADTRLNAVLSPYDGMTIGIIKALEAAGYGKAGKPLPITSGQDAELASVKSIIAGQQTGTVYKDTRELAKVAVQQGNALLTGVAPMVNDTVTFKNGAKVVPTYLLHPVAIDKNNYKILLVNGGYYTAAQLS